MSKQVRKASCTGLVIILLAAFSSVYGAVSINLFAENLVKLFLSCLVFGNEAAKALDEFLV